MNAIIDAAQALEGLLRIAEEEQLPLPKSAEVSRFAPYGSAAYEDKQYATGGIEFIVEPEQLADWATWLDSPIVDNEKPYQGKLHRHAYGTVGPIPIRVTALFPVENLVTA